MLALTALSFLLSPHARAEVVIEASPVERKKTQKRSGPTVEAPAENPKKKQPLPQGSLSFKDGNLMRGRLLALDAKGHITWNHPDAVQPIVFKPENIAAIRLPRDPGKIPVSKSNITLMNGDHLPCKVVSLNEAELKIDTWFGGPFTVKRDAVSAISPNSIASNTLYAGPDKLQGWTLQHPNGNANQPWEYRNGAFYEKSQGSVGRRFENLPDQFSLKFSLAWTGQNLNFSIGLLTENYEGKKGAAKEKPDDDEEEEKPKDGEKAEAEPAAPRAEKATVKAKPKVKKNEDGKKKAQKVKVEVVNNYTSLIQNGYVLTLSPYNCSLSRSITKDGNSNWTALGNGNNFNLQQLTRMSVELRIDRPKKSFALFINGILRAKWRDSDENFEPGGHGISFMTYGRSRMRLKNITIQPWNGRLGYEEELTADATDIVKLVNGTDRLSGKALAFKDGKLALKASYGDIELPEARVAKLYLATKGKSRPEPSDKALRFVFRRGGSIRLIPEGVQDGKLTGTHSLLGKCEIETKAFSRIEFANTEEEEAGVAGGQPFLGQIDQLWEQ